MFLGHLREVCCIVTMLALDWNADCHHFDEPFPAKRLGGWISRFLKYASL